MSTMKRPEMEVVRFKEADIIVASATLYNFNNNQSGDGLIHYGGTDYTSSNQSSFPGYDGVKFYNNNTNNDNKAVSELFNMDSSDNVLNDEWNGTYTFYNGNFYKKQ